jgi:hypothetical protein
LSDEAFVELLPLVRRAFSSFDPSERRSMAEKVKRLAHAPAADDGVQRRRIRNDIDPERAALVRPVLNLVLGVELPDEPV